jgi:predicted Zn-dependent protease
MLFAVPLRLAALLALAALAACETVPSTGRSEINLLDPAVEAQLGDKAFAEVEAQHKISHDPAANATVERVGRRLAAASGLKEDWQFIVIDEKQVNAFALPGGKVAVYQGLLPVAENDAGLATVLAHEIGHVMAHHSAERISRSQLMETGTNVLASLLGGGSPESEQMLGALLGAGTTFGIELPFSRQQEYEADHIGLDLIAKAGYDPRAALAFRQRMTAQAQSGSVSELLSDHPSDQNRIAELQRLMPEALGYYRPG